MKGFMVFVEGCNTPKVVHKDHKSALYQAYRLAETNPGKEVMLLNIAKRLRYTEGAEKAESIGSHLPSRDTKHCDKADLVTHEAI